MLQKLKATWVKLPFLVQLALLADSEGANRTMPHDNFQTEVD